jgi:hypothetical protein
MDEPRMTILVSNDYDMKLYSEVQHASALIR